MGGKTKLTQRTKNNARPSNSGRSAELFGASLPTFVGFTSLSHCGDVSVLPGFATTPTTIGGADCMPDEIDASIDSNYQIVLRKMTKKDPITKVKALLEFAELVNNSELETVSSILPFWPRLYANLSTDVEHRVREASQQAQAAVSLKCGKNIAPYLRQLAPSWITSQYDTYAPAASLATASFQKAFRPYKQQEVFNFCQNEILEYIIKNLTVFTATTLSSAKTYTPEECEAKYQRIVTCSLKGYAQYLSKMSAEMLQEASNKNRLLIDNPKFWTFHKHKSGQVRAAWFETLSSLVQYAPHFIENHQQQATQCALQTLDESEPVVLPHVWSAILLVTQKVPNWTDHVNMEKALLPKLWKVIKAGGNGNAAVIYPHLLPLLAKLNGDALGDKLQTFYTDFFKNMNIGLVARSMQQSRSEIAAIVTAYYECLQYVIIQMQRVQLLPIDELTVFCKEAVRQHMVDVIAWCLHDEQHCSKYVFAQVSALCNYWTQNSPDNLLYAAVLQYFWQEVYTVLEKSLDTGGADRLERTLNMHFDLVQSFRSGQSHRTKSKVKFSTADEDDTVDGAVSGSTPTKPPVRLADFNETAFRLCTIYLKRTTETMSPLFVNNLENLFKAFGSAEFFLRLSGDAGVAKLYDKFSVWLLIEQLRQENVIDIILQLYPFLDGNEKTALLSKLVKFPNEQVQSWVIARLLSHPLCVEPNIPKLLAQPNVAKVLLKCAQSVADGHTKDNINFLHKCFFQNEAGEILIDAETCRAIIQVIAAAFDDDGRVGVLDTCASFLAQIMPVICSDDAKKELQHFMFLKFFEFSVNKSVSEELTEDTLWEITTSWQDALSSNDLHLNDALLDRCAAIIYAKLSAADEISVQQIEAIAEIVSKLILCSIERLDSDVDKYAKADAIIDTIFNQNCKLYRSQVADLEHLCLFLEAMNECLAVPAIGHRSVGSNDIESLECVDQLLKLAVFKFNVVFKITCTISKKKTDEPATTCVDGAGDDECTEDFCDVEENLIKSWSDNIFDEILDAIHVASMSNSLLQHSSALPEPIENLILNLSEAVVVYLKNISPKNVGSVKERLFVAANTNGLLWSKSLLFLANVEPYANNGDNGMVLLYEDATVNASESVTYTNILQSFTSKIGARLLPIARNIVVTDAADEEAPLRLLDRTVALRCLIQNYSHGDFNNVEDRRIVDGSLALLRRLYAKSKADKQFFLYNEDILNAPSEKVVLITEIANLYAAVIRHFPISLETNEWDLLRIAVSSWVLTLSKSSDNFQSVKVALFISAIYKLFGALSMFIVAEKRKSSTQQLTTVIEEWEHLFAKDVNLILLKCYLKMVSNQNKHKEADHYFIESLSTTIHTIDFKYVLAANRIDSKTSMDDLVTFALENIGHHCHNVRMSCVCILRKLSRGLIAKDLEQMQRQNDNTDVKTATGGNATASSLTPWHLLHKFDKTIRKYNDMMAGYTEEFSFKTIELDHLSEVPSSLTVPYLLLWDCVLDICSKSLAELRSTYASYLTENGFVQTMLAALFRLMPVEILRSQDAKHIGQAYFAPLSFEQIMDDNLSPERYACYVYVQTLRHLPAAARKWWHDSTPSPKTMVDKITTSFVSAQLCQDELRGLIEKKEKHENMQLTVHTSTREVLATYSIDEARMELIVTLPINHPLGSVKVDSGKQIGGRLQSRVLVMQLSIFLTHQNGSIADGLSLWKRNLDRKFEGVQECYVCYSVIHQDTCQLPKLLCRKCKNKFHGPCLYKWFSTSNKSTCPICRNMF